MAGICLIAVAFVAAGLPVYIHPQTDALRRADAIFVLGGEAYERYTAGIELAVAGWAPVIVLSNPHGSDDRWLTEYCATPHPPIDLRCFVPDPPTTKGEGRELRRMAEQFNWKTIIVVTFTPHVSRARYILRQCFDGELIMVASPANLSVANWAYQYMYQTAGYVRAALQPNC